MWSSLLYFPGTWISIMFIFVFVHLYLCICICAFVFVHLYLCICICAFVFVHYLTQKIPLPYEHYWLVLKILKFRSQNFFAFLDSFSSILNSSHYFPLLFMTYFKDFNFQVISFRFFSWPIFQYSKFKSLFPTITYDLF